MGGFSAYAIVPSARLLNHSGLLFTQGWSGEVCKARSIAISSPCLPAAFTNSSKSFMVPSAGLIASWPPSALPIAHGTPQSSSLASRVLFFPLRCEIPIGCTGGRYKTSKPIAATPGKRLVAVANVPEVTEPSAFLTAPSLRGKNSYQEPTKALSLSARTGY